jgi:ankyrin repeat protein
MRRKPAAAVRVAATDADDARDVAIVALLAAADGGDSDKAAELVDAHPDIVSARGLLHARNGLRTALHFAVARSDERLVALLLERGADPNVRDEGDDAMPLHFAAEKEHLPIIRLLIEHGADPIGEGTVHELDVLGWATVFGTARADVVDYLLAHGARHTIYSAVATGDASAIRAIAARTPEVLDHPMDRANVSRRPLHLAVVKKQPGSLATLLELGADVDAVDAAGLTPLDEAAFANEAELTRLLVERGARFSLPAAIAMRRMDDVERLLREDPDSLRPGGRWATLIVRASERAKGPVVEALIRGGAAVDAVDDTGTSIDSTVGYTALHAAAFHGNSAAVAVLMRHGANVRARDGRYCGTPAGWANHANHPELRDFILTGAIDLFDAVAFGLTSRMAEIVAGEPRMLDLRFGELVPGRQYYWPDASFTPLMSAAENGDVDAVRVLLELGADPALRDAAGRDVVEIAPAEQREAIATLVRNATAPVAPSPEAGARAGRAAIFLRGACLDWRTNGSQRDMRTHDAARILRRDPEVARDSIYAAIAAGDVEHVERLLADRPERASEVGGSRRWAPLLYLCGARLPTAAASENALAIARALLDRGADPNSYYFGGQSTIHYSALTVLLGRGEEQASTHPRALALADLLLERGAEPYDTQLLYNVFANHASRNTLSDDDVWILELIHRHSVRRGRDADWRDPSWAMLDVGGYGPGAYFLLTAAVAGNHLGLAQWMLEHGASPDTAPSVPRGAQHSLYEHAHRSGFEQMAELMAEHGATRTTMRREGYDAFADACLRLDRAAAERILSEHPEYLQKPDAMFTAVGRNRTDVVALLLDLGVSPDIGNPAEGERRALHVAAYAGAIDVARLLVDAGADVDFRESSYGAIPLGVAMWAKRPRMVEFLGQLSRDVWELVHSGQVERLREVLGENPLLATIRSSDGDTPLMWLPSDDASAMEIAKLLLAHGADAAARNEQGRTAADVARERGLEDVADLLSG